MNQADFEAALATNPVFDGQGTTIEINSECCLPAHPTARTIIRNTTFVDVNPLDGVVKRMLWKAGGGPVITERVKIDRGSNPRTGGLGPAYQDIAAGMWLQGVPDCELDLEITGKGKGAGLYLQDCPEFSSHNRLHVHDMQFEYNGSTAGMHEQLLGIWINYTDADTQRRSRFRLNAPRVKNLSGVINGVTRGHQTDGITLGGTYNCSIDRPEVENCGEGIDATGSRGNMGLSITGGYVQGCDSFGVKLACSAQWAQVVGIDIWNCGYAGLMVNGPVESEPPTHNILVRDVSVFNAGSNGLWSAYNVVGFGVMSNLADWPQSVLFENCLAWDTQETKTMKYGYRNENNNVSNKLRNCRSLGHAVASTLGSWG